LNPVGAASRLRLASTNYPITNCPITESPNSVCVSVAKKIAR
jgi:hypothetical protein